MKKDNRDRTEYRKSYYEREKKEHALNPEKRAFKFIYYNYGLSEEEFKLLEQTQQGVCAICGQPETVSRLKRLSVDHCHKTGKIRGLLCSNCNNGIGRFKDSAILLRKAAEYIEPEVARFRDI